MNKSVARLDLQDKTAHISSLNKTPASIVHEYAAKNHLVPKYNLIHIGISQSKVTFKYSLILGDYETVGEGSSKKEAKHEASFKILKKMISDNPKLLVTDFKEWDFDNHVVSPFDNIIKVNAIGQLNEICSTNKLALPEFHLVREEGQAHAKLFTISCHLSKMVEIATHKTKKQAKHLSAVQMVKRFMSLDEPLVMERGNFIDSMKVLERVEFIKSEFTKTNAPMDENLANYHLLFKTTDWSNPEILKNALEQNFSNGKLNTSNPLKVLNTLVQECGMILIEKVMHKDNLACKNSNCYVLAINNVYPPIYGFGVNCDIKLAKNMAATHLLENIFILSK